MLKYGGEGVLLSKRTLRTRGGVLPLDVSFVDPPMPERRHALG